MLKYRYNGVRKRRTILLSIVIALLVVIAAGGIFAQRTYSNNLKPLSNSENSQTITVESGWTAQQIADKLEEAKIIRKSWAFQWYVRNNGLRDKLQAGTYSLKPSQSVQQIVTILTKGEVDTKLVTILPAKRLDEIKSDLINDGFAEDAVEKAFDPTLYEGHPALVDKPVTASLEGYLYPETFQRTASTTPQDIIKSSLDQMALRLTPQLRAAFVAQGLTVHQGVILASIIEEEVPDSNPADRPQVSQVFLKRFRQNIPFQSNVTAYYGSIINGQTADNVSYDSPYNTYLYKGLPPGPISNVEESSLEAVANPANTDYLYFVTGDNGTTYFSKTVEEHNNLVREYCKKGCAQH